MEYERGHASPVNTEPASRRGKHSLIRRKKKYTYGLKKSPDNSGEKNKIKKIRNKKNAIVSGSLI